MAKRSSTARGARFLPLKGGRKSDQVFDQISEFIRSGRFPTGGKLPAERELAALFKTSRQTIREAIYHAELVGLIEVRHGTGSFVVSRRPQAPARVGTTQRTGMADLSTTDRGLALEPRHPRLPLVPA